MKTVSSKSMETLTEQNEKISYEDFLEWCDEDTLAEWVNGDIIMASPASKRHQDIGSFLEIILHLYIKPQNLGELERSPFQMRLTLSGRELDLLYVSNSKLDHFSKTYLDGPADMVVEIVSEESIRRDYKDKYTEYESAGITEYWLIDPINEEANFYHLGEDNQYHLIQINADGIFHSIVIPGFWLKVSWLWQEPLPPIKDVLYEMNLI